MQHRQELDPTPTELLSIKIQVVPPPPILVLNLRFFTIHPQSRIINI